MLGAAFLALCGVVSGCFAQSHKLEPAPLSDNRTEILKTVRLAYETPTQKYLCPGKTPAVRDKVKARFTKVFSEDILNEYFSDAGLCEVLAGSRFGSILDTPEAVKQTYSLTFGKPYTLKGQTIAEVRFRPMFKGKPGEEGGAIVYLKRLNGDWKITNIESIDYLGANGFTSLIPNYPTVSSDVWADMDYSKSLARPEHRH